MIRRMVLLLAAVMLLAPPVRADPLPKKARRMKTQKPEPTPVGLEEVLARGKDPLRRESAAQVLGLRGDPELVPLLARALSKDENLWVRARAAEALGEIGSPAGIPALTSALASEKDQRVRRMIGNALVRLGQPSGVKELMWQLRAGTNHTRAEVMAFLVGITGQPFGQTVDAWWNYLHNEGRLFLARRPSGSPAIHALAGLAPPGKTSPRHGPFLFAAATVGYLQVPAVVITIEPPTAGGVGRALLTQYEQRYGRIPDRSLLLLRTRFKEVGPTPPAKPSPAPVPRRMPAKKRAAGKAEPVEPGGPWLAVDGARYLLERAPKMIGVGIDAPTLDGSPAVRAERPARALLLQRGRLVIESLGDLDRIVAAGTRMVIVGQGARQPSGLQPAKIIAVLP